MNGNYNETDQIWKINGLDGVVFEISTRTIPHLPSDMICVKEDYIERIFRNIFGNENITAKLVNQFTICEKIEMKILYTGDNHNTKMIAFEKKEGSLLYQKKN